MIALKTPVGIDKPISSLQKQFYSVLPKTWNIDPAKYNCYPRGYRNQNDNGFTAEVFDGKDYTEVYFNDTVSVVSFFSVGSEIQVSGDNVMTANVQILFFVNLQDIRPGSDRNDEQVRLDVQKIIETWQAHGFKITKQLTGIDKILSEFPGTRQGIKFRDLHPLHCFRFDTQVYYQPTLTQCSL